MVSWLACRKVNKPTTYVRKAMDMAGAEIIFAATIAMTAAAIPIAATSVVKVATPTTRKRRLQQ
jgi:hypothetical protein